MSLHHLALSPPGLQGQDILTVASVFCLESAHSFYDQVLGTFGFWGQESKSVMLM